jgi:hypothetical protein
MVNRQPLAAGPVAPRPATPAGEPTPAWPILAQLPWIDGSFATHDAYAAANDNQSNPVVEPPPRTILPPRYARILEPLQSYDGPPAVTSDVAAREAPIQQWRLDAGANVLNKAVTPQPHAPAFMPEKATLSARLFQLHAALAPHAGLSMTAALVLAVGVLSWLTFGARFTVTPAKSAQTPLWPEKATTPLTLNQPATMFSPTDDLSQFSWSARLLPKPVPATVDEPASPIVKAAPAEPSHVSGAEAAPAPLEAKPVAGNPKNDSSPVASTAKPASNNPITPTPNVFEYPSTRFYENSRMIDPSFLQEQPAVSATPTSSPSR